MEFQVRRFRKKSNFCVVLHFAIIQRTISTPHDYKICTPFYPERFIRGNLNFLRNRSNQTFYEFINLSLQWENFENPYFTRSSQV